LFDLQGLTGGLGRGWLKRLLIMAHLLPLAAARASASFWRVRASAEAAAALTKKEARNSAMVHQLMANTAADCWQVGAVGAVVGGQGWVSNLPIGHIVAAPERQQHQFQ
jgi:hypothetical protein